MKILISNPGTTSYKCKLYETSSMEILFQAVVERIGDKKGIYSYRLDDNQGKSVLEIKDYQSAVQLTIDTLSTRYSVAGISAIGFKTVHAKGKTGCLELTPEVIDAMKEFRLLAPVHTDVYLTAISIFKHILPNKPLIGLFETHFHEHIPPEAYLYGIPFKYYETYGIRKYGFHGASHRYISERAQELFGAEKIISCHLGGSSSVCAIKKGYSIDTSMGMSPQSGLLNAKRVGDFDAYALLYLMEKESMSINDAVEVLMNKGGLLGISGLSGDLRDIEEEMLKGNQRAEHAFRTFAYYVKRYIGEYMAVLNRADCIVFTAGAGQNSPRLRKEILSGMDNLGILLSDERNEENPMEGIISNDDSTVKTAVIPTNEEFIVAREVKDYLEKNK